MTAAVTSGDTGRALPVASGVPAAAAMAVSVGLLVAGTLGTVAAVIVGASLHLAGVPDAWATGTGGLVAVASLVPSAALAHRVWLVERHGPDL